MERKTRKKTPALSPDALVEKLVLEPGKLKGLRVELGFLGRSDRAGYWRLYRSPELGDFIEVREADVRHSQSLESDRNPLGGTILWLSRTALVTRVTIDSAPSQSDFLQGSLMRTFLPGTGIGGLRPGGGAAVPAIWTAFTSEPCAVVTIGLIIYSAIKCEGDGHTEGDDDDDDDDDGGEGEGAD
jgi:hypothetical protein